MNEMTTPTDLAQALHTLLGACAFLTIQSDGRGYFESGQNVNRFRQAIADGWKALDSAAHERAQPASVGDCQKPVVHCERIDGIEHCLGDAQVAHLSGVHGHPRLGGIPWARTSRIVSIETKNTVYVVGKAAAPQPAKGDENGK